MHGYAAFGRVVPAEIRTGRPLIASWDPPGRALEPGGEPVDVEDVSPGALTVSIGARLRDKLADVREGWSQATFYLFDPNSWG